MLAKAKPKPTPYVRVQPPAQPFHLRRRLLMALAGGLGSVAVFTLLLRQVDAEMLTVFLSVGGALLFAVVPAVERVQALLAHMHWRLFDVLYGINAGVWFLAGAAAFGLFRSWKVALLVWGFLALGLLITNSDLSLVWRFATLTPAG